MNKRFSIMGAVIGDIVGSRFEFHPIKTKDFNLFSENDCINKDGKLTLGYFVKGCRFTDDTVMTLAICKALMACNNDYTNLSENAVKYMRELGQKYPLVGYGGHFNTWLHIPEPTPYNSCGNGSAMRVSAVAYFAKTLEEVKELSRKVSEVTHNHPEGIKGAEAVAVAIWMAIHNATKEEIINHIEENYYKLDFDNDELVKNYKFHETCQETVPEALFAFKISNSFEDTIRTVVSWGGDADTMSDIAGSIAGVYYGIPKEIEDKAKEFLTNDLLEIVNEFERIK